MSGKVVGSTVQARGELATMVEFKVIRVCRVLCSSRAVGGHTSVKSCVLVSVCVAAVGQKQWYSLYRGRRWSLTSIFVVGSGERSLFARMAYIVHPSVAVASDRSVRTATRAKCRQRRLLSNHQSGRAHL